LADLEWTNTPAQYLLLGLGTLMAILAIAAGAFILLAHDRRYHDPRIQLIFFDSNANTNFSFQGKEALDWKYIFIGKV